MALEGCSNDIGIKGCEEDAVLSTTRNQGGYYPPVSQSAKVINRLLCLSTMKLRVSRLRCVGCVLYKFQFINCVMNPGSNHCICCVPVDYSFDQGLWKTEGQHVFSIAVTLACSEVAM